VAVPPNNPLKLPFYWCCVVLGIVLFGLGALHESWLFAGAGLVAALLSLGAIRVVRQGRNPWWTRAPLDRRESRKRKRRA
jgi:hypothetical protein